MERTTAMTNEEATALRLDLDQFKSDIGRLRDDLSELANGAIRVAKAGAAQTREQVTEGARAAAAKGRHAADTLEEQINEHPLLTAAAAFGIGMAIGVGISRKG
ncbi:MAG: hypothetical protein IPJ41_03840 [Phycisphaerales bacterium]|nr:hypothetical protein [Phycisphaerales bacterium]